MFKLLLCLLLTMACAAPAAQPAAPSAAPQNQSKADLTPTFWQRDPAADFEDEGRMHCAPTAVSDGLIYLDKAFGMKGLVPGRDHDSQIELIKELAEAFETDPSIGGTNPDRILTGLQTYMSDKGFEFSRLEVMTWRGLNNKNKQFKLGTKPELGWMRSAAQAKDTVVIFNFGWYKEGDDGYVRKGGHWVSVVGASGNDFYVHNPAIPVKDQGTKTTISLTKLTEDYIVVKDNDDEANMIGYYYGEGPGLPHSDSVDSAILDAVIVFSLKR